MIQLDKNYSVAVDGTHGFQLNFESDPVEKEVTTKKGKEVKMVTSTDTWYAPKLSMALDTYSKLILKDAVDLKDLKAKVNNLEAAIEKFSKTFAKSGKLMYF